MSFKVWCLCGLLGELLLLVLYDVERWNPFCGCIPKYMMMMMMMMTRWLHDFISSLLSAKWMSESKSAPQITLEGSKTRKKSAKVIDLIWPQLTSVDLRRTGWPVECISTNWCYMSIFISLAKTAMFASFVPRSAFSAWNDPSYDVIGQILGGSGSWNFQGGRKKIGGKL